MTRACLLAGAAAVCMACTAAGCGSSGYTVGTAFREDIRTVAVPVFENATYSTGLEVSLTDALVKEIHRQTPWTVMRTGAADTVLSGTINDADLRKLANSSETGLVQELAVVLTVSFEWREARTGEVLVSRRRFRASSSFVPARGAQERLGTGQEAAIGVMARDIVAEMRSSW